LDHSRDVLQRRSRFRLAKIADRLEVLAGYLLVYLNLDKVIKIIRNEDEPKPKLVKAFKLTERQAEAVLNMRLRSLRKLEETQLRAEHGKLLNEQRALKKLVGSKKLQSERMTSDLKAVDARFGLKTELGKRRTQFSTLPDIDVDVSPEAFVEKEPITVLCSQKLW
ncbi:MAG: DNA gyrase subunit A, partial [Alphaproteobacteria bacterium]